MDSRSRPVVCAQLQQGIEQVNSPIIASEIDHPTLANTVKGVSLRSCSTNLPFRLFAGSNVRFA